jgi:hypothetical protein
LAGGSSSEVPNAAVVGFVSDSLGWPLGGCRVLIRPADYIAGSSSDSSADSAVTDENGQWNASLPRGAWMAHFLSGDSAATRRGWLSPLTVASSATTFQRDTLRTLGWIRGRFAGGYDSSARAYVSGTTLQARGDAEGRFLLGPVPPSPLRLLARRDSAGIALTSILDLTPRSKDTLDVGQLGGDSWQGESYALWPHFRTGVVDLSSQGAAITGDHADFPVLIRLDSVLDPAAVGRDELRFDDGKGRHLPFEIETWDSIAHRADVWVQLDTANGSSSKHFLRAFWGRSQHPSQMPAVFSRTAHFIGAWHPNPSPGSPKLTWTGTASVAGIVGEAKRLSGSGSLRLDSLGPLSQWTMGFWIRPTAKPSGEILLLGTDSGASKYRWGISLRDDLFVRVWSGASADKELVSSKALALDAWTWISASFDSASSRLSLVVDTLALPRLSVSLPSHSQYPVHGFEQFQGDVDEIRLSDTARTRQWQQLEHQTVRPGIPWIRWL